MLAARIIPQLLCRGTQLVKGQRFDAWRAIGTAIQGVKVHQLREVDEIVLLDIGATPEGRSPDLRMISQMADMCFSPLTVGGGVKSVEDVKKLLDHGADKVLVNTAAVYNPLLIEDIAERFGSSTVVAGIDVVPRRGWWYVVTECGKKSQLIEVHEWARSVEYLGAGEILVQSVDREGTMQGYDLDLIRIVSKCVDIPVVAGGGCSGPEDMRQALAAGASGVSAGALFAFSDMTPRVCAQYLHECGVEVRYDAG